MMDILKAILRQFRKISLMTRRHWEAINMGHLQPTWNSQHKPHPLSLALICLHLCYQWTKWQNTVWQVLLTVLSLVVPLFSAPSVVFRFKHLSWPLEYLLHIPTLYDSKGKDHRYSFLNPQGFAPIRCQLLPVNNSPIKMWFCNHLNPHCMQTRFCLQSLCLSTGLKKY